MDNHMRRLEIANAAAKAGRLARRIADLVLSSDVPAAHWDEVSNRVADLLAVQAEEQVDERRQYVVAEPRHVAAE